MMNSPADEALKNDQFRQESSATVERYLSGITVVSALVSAIVKWHEDDAQSMTSNVLGCTKGLIDSVTLAMSDLEIPSEIITEICVGTVAAAWLNDGEFRPEIWIKPITEIIRRMTKTVSTINQFGQEYVKMGQVLCALTSRGIQGENCAIFHGVCDDISSMCEKSLTKIRIIAGPSDEQERAVRKAIHAAACDLFTSTLDHEYKQQSNDCYRASVDSNYKRKPFDMQLFMRRFTLNFEHLCDAIYVNSRQRI